MSFLGQFEHTLDAKNRLTIPASSGAQLSDGVVLAKEQDTCVSIWPVNGWHRFTEQLARQPRPVDEDYRDLQRLLHAGAFEAQLDAAGRIMLPQSLIEHVRPRSRRRR